PESQAPIYCSISKSFYKNRLVPTRLNYCFREKFDRYNSIIKMSTLMFF
ncbi:uncharacterized protein METZ01_LOCUS390447, partial [marine metagenome]